MKCFWLAYYNKKINVGYVWWAMKKSEAHTIKLFPYITAVCFKIIITIISIWGSNKLTLLVYALRPWSVSLLWGSVPRQVYQLLGQIEEALGNKESAVEAYKRLEDFLKKIHHASNDWRLHFWCILLWIHF